MGVLLLCGNLPASSFLERRVAPVDFQLTEDQEQIRKWAHGFAEDEIRPVAAGYDEREEFPWPVVKRAAEVGLYGLEFYTETLAQDASGLLLPIVAEELSWGCAGIA